MKSVEFVTNLQRLYLSKFKIHLFKCVVQICENYFPFENSHLNVKTEVFVCLLNKTYPDYLLFGIFSWLQTCQNLSEIAV